jgi:hypothetical protein
MQKKQNTYRLTVQRDHVTAGIVEFLIIISGTTPGNAELKVITLFDDEGEFWTDTRIMKTVLLQGVDQQLLLQT